MVIVWLICIENILDYIIYKNEKISSKESLQTIFEDRVMLLGGCQCSVIGINFYTTSKSIFNW